MNAMKTYTPKQLQPRKIALCDHVVNNQPVNVNYGGSPEFGTPPPRPMDQKHWLITFTVR